EAVKLYKLSGITVAPADVTGTVKLAAVETVNGIECLRIEAETTVKNYRPPLPRGEKPPADYQVKDGTLVEKAMWLVPADFRGEFQRASYSSDVHYTTSGTIDNRRFTRETHERN